MPNIRTQIKHNDYKKQIKNLEKAMTFAKKNESNESFEYIRESAIQRFEYCTESSRKLLKIILKEIQGIETGGPKDSIKEGENNGYITNVFLRLDILQARNLSLYTYEESEAEEIYKNIPTYLIQFKKLYDNIQKKL